MLPFVLFFPTGIPPVVQTFTNYNAGTQTISKPVGAKKLMIEAIGGGANCVSGGRGATASGGSGAHYACKIPYDVSSLTSVLVTPGAPTQYSVVQNSSDNSTICQAMPGSGINGYPASSSTGDVVNVGGAGSTSINGAGGGAGGPNGPGSSASGTTGGAGGGGVAGSGGSNGSNGGYFGGGAGYYNDGNGNTTQGGSGWIKLTWSF